MGGKVSKSPVIKPSAGSRPEDLFARIPSATSRLSSSVSLSLYKAVEAEGTVENDDDDGLFSGFPLASMDEGDRDDEEVIRTLFQQIDEDRDGHLSNAEIEKFLNENFGKEGEELGRILVSLTEQSRKINFDDFKEALRQIPRVVGQRVHWAGSLKLEVELAKHLKAGTIFDGLKGIRDEMTLEDVKKACAQFCKEVPKIVIRGWNNLKRKKNILAEDVNSKFAMAEGAIKGSYGSLDDFYKGIEARIGHPNPKLYEAMEKEHTRRSNATKMFCTPNYFLSSCTQWEWQWTINPCLPGPAALQSRLAANNGKYPGETGDQYIETVVVFETQNSAPNKFAKILESDLSANILEKMSLTVEDLSRGARISQVATKSQNVTTMSITLPCRKDQFRVDEFKKVVGQLGGVDPGVIQVNKVNEITFEYCTYASQRQFEDALKASSDQGLPDFLENELKMQDKRNTSGALQKFIRQTEEWSNNGKFRKQGRHRIVGGIDDILQIPTVQEIIAKANLRKEEVIALRLYTGPCYLLYNATLRVFPQSILNVLEGNKLETTIFVIISGIVKLSKVTKIPNNRFLYRGLGGMLLPDEFWRSGSSFQGGVELGLMSTTMEKRIAIQYSGLEQKRAIVFEIMAGRIDIGGSLGFISQYPGEAEYLMPPLTCLEVMGKPRVEMTDQGEIIVFPMRANVNLKSITVDQLENRRKELHLAIISNLQEELFQWLEAALAESEASASVKLSENMIPEAVSRIKDEFRGIYERHNNLEPEIFNDEDNYKELIAEAIDSKVLAMRKMSFFRKEINNNSLSVDKKLLSRILATSLKEFSKEGIELQMRTGIDDFPWHDIMAQKPAIDLGQWTPVGLEPWKLDQTRKVLAQNTAIKGVTIKGHIIPFKVGIMEEEINLDRQPVKGVAAELGFVLSINQNLTSLSLRENGLDTLDWSLLLEALRGCVKLSRINNCDFTDALREDLVTLDLRGRGIDKEGGAVIGGLLILSSSTLTSLSLALTPSSDSSQRKSTNVLSKEGGTALSEGLRSASMLQVLNLSSNSLSKEGGTAIAGAFRFITALQFLDLRSNALGKEGGTAIASGLQYIPALQVLDLQGNDLAKEGGTAIAEALQHVTSLLSFDMSANRLSKEGGTAIANYLRHLPNLTMLNLNSNALSKEGGTDIAEDLRHLTCLQILELQGNELGKEGGTAIAKGLRHVPSLQVLNISFNGLSKEGGIAIAERLRVVSSLHTLNLGSNSLNKEGAMSIAENLRHITNLRSLDLTWNEVSHEGAMSLAEALRFSTVLNTLNLRFNRLDHDVIWRVRNKLTAVKNLLLADLAA